MIEGPSGPAPARGPLRRLTFWRVIEEIGARVGTLWRWALPSGQHREGDVLLWRLRIGERVLWVVLGALAVYLVAELAFHPLHPPAMVMPSSRAAVPEAHAPSAAAPDEQLKSFAEYRETLAARNPFGLTAHAIVQAVTEHGSKGQLTELISSLSVVGVNRGRVPEALVEDTQAKRTYFVKVGDQINQITVKSIDQRGVLVTYENEEAFLK